jgi:4-diphosphocytidyl-2-C-methyl-D-erythritol kinase
VLTTRAPGKVNLCLLVGAPRPDGLHPLVSIVQPVDLADTLTLTLKGPGPFNFAASETTASGAAGQAGQPAQRAAVDVVICPGVDGDNLALRALREFRAATGWDGPPVQLTIDKRLPIAAGMAGGSSDAAAALRLAAQASGLPIPNHLPMRLGADVTVMLDPKRALMTGAGEHVEPLDGPKPPLIVVPLDAQLSTAAVYRHFDASATPRTPEELAHAAQRARAGDFEYTNDLEGAARALCPEIDAALEALAQAGVEHAMVTGSGPTVFGISDDPDAVRRLHEAGYTRATAA